MNMTKAQKARARAKARARNAKRNAIVTANQSAPAVIPNRVVRNHDGSLSVVRGDALTRSGVDSLKGHAHSGFRDSSIRFAAKPSKGK